MIEPRGWRSSWRPRNVVWQKQFPRRKSRVEVVEFLGRQSILSHPAYDLGDNLPSGGLLSSSSSSSSSFPSSPSSLSYPTPLVKSGQSFSTFLMDQRRRLSHKLAYQNTHTHTQIKWPSQNLSHTRSPAGWLLRVCAVRNVQRMSENEPKSFRFRIAASNSSRRTSAAQQDYDSSGTLRRVVLGWAQKQTENYRTVAGWRTSPSFR